MKNARWDLYLPPDYDYSRFEGSMTRTSDADAADGAGLFALRIQRPAAGPGGAEQIRTCATGWRRRAKTSRAATCSKAISSYSRAKIKGASSTDAASGEGPRTQGAGAGRAPGPEQQPDRRAEQLLLLDNAGKLGGPAGAAAPGRPGPQPTRPLNSSRPCRRPARPGTCT